MEKEGDREGAFLALDDLMDEIVLLLEEPLTQYC
jgi:hypothetical protein